MRHFVHSLFLFIILLLPPLVFAGSVKQLDIDELIEQSELIFQGQVIKQSARWNSTKTDILTDITFRVDDVIVGTYANDELTLSFVGGTVDQMSVTIEGSEMPALNESGVYFVSSTTQLLVNPIVGWAQGHFLTKKDETGTPRMMTQDKAPISGLNMSQPKTKFISDGVATGVTQINSDSFSEAMTLNNFKSLLRAQAGNQ